MRVVVLSWEYPPHIVGGLGSHVAALVPALSRQGVEVHVVTPRRAEGAWREMTPEGADIIRVEPAISQTGNFADDVEQTNFNLREAAMDVLGRFDRRVDVVHAHDWLVAFAAHAIQHSYQVPVVATIHATERGRGRGGLWNELSHRINDVERLLCDTASRVITTSHYMANEVADYFGVPVSKIDIVPNGVDTAPFDAADGNLEEFRPRFTGPDEKLVFHVGRLVQEKGSHLLIEAVPGILTDVPTARFILAGRGPMLDGLVSRAWALGVAERILFTGFISDVERNRLFKVADCAVFPSLYEPFGIVALEAMAARCPVVVASTGGLAEVVRLYETGMTVYPGNVDSLTWGIVQTLTRPEQARAAAERAYQVVKTEYNWDHIARLTIEIYRRVMGE